MEGLKNTTETDPSPRAVVETQNEQRDPSQSSLREEAINESDLEYTGKGRRYLNTRTREVFHRIKPNEIPQQRLLILLLKGVVNVSDIVRIGDHYYSHQQDLDTIVAHSENIGAEVAADLFILKNIFEDVDHFDDYKEHKEGNEMDELKNMRMDIEGGKANFFDFECAFNLSLRSFVTRTVSAVSLIRFGAAKFKIRHPDGEATTILKKKIDALGKLFSDEEFSNFNAMIKRAGVELDQDKQKELFESIKARLLAALDGLS